MADKSPESSPRVKLRNEAANTKVLIISIISFAIVIALAVWTLLRTDFSGNEEVDIASITKAPQGLFEEIEFSDDAEEDLVVVDTDPESMETSVVTTELKISVEEELKLLLLSQQQEIEMLQTEFAALERNAAQKDGLIQGLQEELEIARREATIKAVIADTDPSDLDAVAIDHAVYELRQQVAELIEIRLRLETQLADADERQRENSHALQQYELKGRESELRIRELTRRQDDLARRLETNSRERAQLEDRIALQQGKLTAQERSFQDLSNAVKSHKNALRQMDQARMELASELDATKTKYVKLLQAVSTQSKDSAHSVQPNNFVSMASEPASIAPKSQEGTDTRYHVVSKGDTLTSISRHFYGTAQRWHEVYDANKAILADQNRLKVGLVLVIP